MTTRVRLERRAAERIEEIVLWTFRRFGARQAERYRAKLAAAIDRLVDGTLRGRSARAEWGDGVREELLFVRVERHVVVYFEEPGEVVVTDVLHEAMDLAGRVGETEG